MKDYCTPRRVLIRLSAVDKKRFILLSLLCIITKVLISYVFTTVVYGTNESEVSISLEDASGVYECFTSMLTR